MTASIQQLTVNLTHAGDTGRGFNVVAEEIGRLSEQKSGQTKNIKSKAQNNIAGVKEDLESNEDASFQYRTITGEVFAVTSSIEEIISSMSEMNQGIARINQAIAHLIEQSEKSSGSFETVSDSISVNHGMIKSLKEGFTGAKPLMAFVFLLFILKPFIGNSQDKFCTVIFFQIN